MSLALFYVWEDGEGQGSLACCSTWGWRWGITKRDGHDLTAEKHQQQFVWEDQEPERIEIIPGTSLVAQWLRLHAAGGTG